MTTLPARFGDTASQAGIFALLASNPFLSRMPSPLKTVFASLVGALFRMVLMPIDALKTTMQTDGTRPALRILSERVKRYGPATLWAGAFATAAANFVGSWPWFATYNLLSSNLPMPKDGDVWGRLARQAFIGFVASVVSDTCSNSLRVIKTYRQVNQTKVSYRESKRRAFGLSIPARVGAELIIVRIAFQARPSALSCRPKVLAASLVEGSRLATSPTDCRVYSSASSGRRLQTCWTSIGVVAETAAIGPTRGTLAMGPTIAVTAITRSRSRPERPCLCR